jgi:hypothetical protein
VGHGGKTVELIGELEELWFVGADEDTVTFCDRLSYENRA